MRTSVGTLVTLYTVLAVPYGHEALYTTLFIGRGSVLPGTVCGAMVDEIRDFQQVACLRIHRTCKLFYECRSIVLCLVVIGKIGPCGVNGKHFVFASTVDGSVIQLDNVLTFLAV